MVVRVGPATQAQMQMGQRCELHWNGTVSWGAQPALYAYSIQEASQLHTGAHPVSVKFPEVHKTAEDNSCKNDQNVQLSKVIPSAPVAKSRGQVLPNFCTKCVAQRIHQRASQLQIGAHPAVCWWMPMKWETAKRKYMVKKWKRVVCANQSCLPLPRQASQSTTGANPAVCRRECSTDH